jgi:transcriptional regulator with XRE-family HTH domain
MTGTNRCAQYCASPFFRQSKSADSSGTLITQLHGRMDVNARRGPTLRAQMLGQQLRELREEARLTLKDVAEYVQRDASTVSRFESGMLPARVPEVLAYLDLCGINDPRRRDALKRLSQDVFQKGWWDGYADDVAGSLVDRIWLESRARAIHTFQVVVLPGLLQTPDYAETVIRADDPDAPDEQVRRWVEVRMNRQQLLTRAEPVQFSAIIDEAVLHRKVGGNACMRVQLEHLLALAKKPNVEITVLPAETGAHASPGGAFEIFEMPDPYPEVGYVQTPAGEICVEASGVERLATAYDRLRGMALGRRNALAFIRNAAKEMQ